MTDPPSANDSDREDFFEEAQAWKNLKSLPFRKQSSLLKANLSKIENNRRPSQSSSSTEQTESVYIESFIQNNPTTTQEHQSFNHTLSGQITKDAKKSVAALQSFHENVAEVGGKPAADSVTEQTLKRLKYYSHK